MAIAYLYEFAASDDLTTTNYDAGTQRMGIDADRPDGLLVHCAGFTEDGTFRMFEVWTSDELEQRFTAERLMPAIREVAGDTPPPARRERYELHHVVV